MQISFIYSNAQLFLLNIFKTSVKCNKSEKFDVNLLPCTIQFRSCYELYSSIENNRKEVEVHFANYRSVNFARLIVSSKLILAHATYEKW